MRWLLPTVDSFSLRSRRLIRWLEDHGSIDGRFGLRDLQFEQDPGTNDKPNDYAPVNARRSATHSDTASPPTCEPNVPTVAASSPVRRADECQYAGRGATAAPRGDPGQPVPPPRQHGLQLALDPQRPPDGSCRSASHRAAGRTAGSQSRLVKRPAQRRNRAPGPISLRPQLPPRWLNRRCRRPRAGPGSGRHAQESPRRAHLAGQRPPCASLPWRASPVPAMPAASLPSSTSDQPSRTTGRTLP
jgi:hypothetical protein